MGNHTNTGQKTRSCCGTSLEGQRVGEVPRGRALPQNVNRQVEDKAVKTLIVRVVREEAGQDIIEYSLLGAFISVVAWLTLENIGEDVEVMYSNIQSATSDASS